MNKFAETLKNELNSRNLTLKKFCELTGFSIFSVKGWLYKDHLPDVLSAFVAAQALGVDVEYLVTGQKKEEHIIQEKDLLIREIKTTEYIYVLPNDLQQIIDKYSTKPQTDTSEGN